MNNLTIRNLDSNTLTRLQERAKNNDRSLEDEAYAILAEALECGPNRANLATSIRSRITTHLLVNLPLPPRN